MRYIAGIDEVGRGPLAGPVVAAAVILDPNRPIKGLTDSKKLSKSRREGLHDEIVGQSLAYAFGRAEVEEIDDINILQATMLAMQRAVAALKIQPDHALVDGNRCPELICSVEAIIKGDLTEPAISAASIIAKVCRDREMIALDVQYPGYGLAAHKGYGTKFHIEALYRLGPSAIHRQSFRPVSEML